jgi:hypothetical protein
MSKIKDTLRRFEEGLNVEATRIEESIQAMKEDIRESVEGYIDFENKKTVYREFYLAKLKEAGVESEDDMEDEDEKEKFKKDVEESWEGEKLEDSVIEAIKLEAVVTPEFKSDDPRESEEDAKGKPNVTDEGGDVVDPPADTIEEPGKEQDTVSDNDDAAPEDEKVDDQTDVSQEEPAENKGEKDTSGDPLK